jgi:hypothetical protein
MSSESLCQVARSWVDVGSFHTRLLGVVYVTCGDFHDGSEKGTASVTNTRGDPQAAQLLKLLHEFKSSSVRIDVRPFMTLLRR